MSNISSDNLQKQLKKLWTVQDVRKKYGRSGMTVHLWRLHRGLPAVVIPGDKRPSIRFVPQEVQRWAKKNKITLAKAS